MTVKVLLFAAARDLLGQCELEIELDQGSTVADLRASLVETCPEIEDLLLSSNWSVNQKYVNDDQSLTDGCEVGLIVPVSGG